MRSNGSQQQAVPMIAVKTAPRVASRAPRSFIGPLLAGAAPTLPSLKLGEERVGAGSTASLARTSLTALFTLPRQQEPCGFIVSHGQYPCWTMRLMRSG